MAVTPWTAGAKITAARLNQMLPVWTSWTPTWTTSTGLHSPSYGNATVTCAYCQTGDLVVCKFDILFGSTTNFGATPATSDNWQFSLPVTADAAAQAGGWVVGNYDASALHDLVWRAHLTSTTNMIFNSASGEGDGANPTNLGVMDSLTHGTWVSGGFIRGNFFYQAA